MTRAYPLALTALLLTDCGSAISCGPSEQETVQYAAECAHGHSVNRAPV